jgi:ribosomal protein S18 acetylase RimI-like enzyme
MQVSLNYNVRDAAARDLDGILRVHESAFPGFFLTSLGPSFLRMLYAGFISESSGVLLVGEAPQGSIVGLLAGARSPQGFFRLLRRHQGLAMGLAALPGLLRHPIRVAQRLVVAISYRGDEVPGLDDYWLLSSLGVAKNCVGSGIGGKLVERFCDTARTEGAAGVYLLTDGDNNEATLSFYAKHDFLIHSERDRHHGRRMLTLAKSFSV